MWVYIESIDEKGNPRYLDEFYFHPFKIEAKKIKRFAVGFFHPGSGKFIIESQHCAGYQARSRIRIMNGGNDMNESNEDEY